MEKGLRRKKAFTLVEAMVVMGIMALVLSFGTVGVIRFRDYIELQNGFSDISTYIRTVQNMARNSVSYDNVGGVPVVPDYYSIFFTANDFSLLACNDTGVINRVNCTQVTRDIQAPNFSKVGFSFGGDCGNRRLFGFERSTVDLMTYQGAVNQSGNLSLTNGVKQSTGSCTIIVTHSRSNSSRNITLNLTENSINVEN